MNLARWRNGRRRVSGDDGTTTENAVGVQLELHHYRKSGVSSRPGIQAWFSQSYPMDAAPSRDQQVL